MDEDSNAQFPFTRRTTRSALAEITVSAGGFSADDNIPNQTDVTPSEYNGGVLNSSNRGSDASLSSLSQDEIVIQQRGRRKLPITWSPDIDATKREGPSAEERTPDRMAVQEGPSTSTIVLRSTPRKRLLLNDPKEACSSSTERSRKVSPTKKMRIDKSSMCCLMASPSVSTPPAPTSSPVSSSTPFQSALKGLSQDQLIQIFENVLKKYPHLEPEIMETLPAPDLKPLEEKLDYLKKNIYKSLPTSRLTSKTDSPAYSRAATHVAAFKKCVIEQGRVLMDSQHYSSVLEYVILAWRYVNATPLWDNPPHNAARKQCFRSLATMAVNALKKGDWSSEKIEEIYSRFTELDPDNEEMQICVRYIAQLRKL